MARSTQQDSANPAPNSQPPAGSDRLFSSACAVSFALLCLLAWTAVGITEDQPAPAKPNPTKPAEKIEQAALFAEHPNAVGSVAFSPDGTVLSAGSYEVVKLWDIASQKAVGEIPVKSGFARAVAYSPDGQILAVGGYQALTLWDAAQRTQLRACSGHRGYVTGVAFSADGKRLATSSEDETARVWDVATGEQKLVLNGHRYPVNAVAFSADGRWLATAAGDETRLTRPGEVKLWDAATGELKHTLPEHARVATAVAFSPDSRVLASAGVDEVVKLWDVSEAKALPDYTEHSRPVNSLAFSPDGKFLVSGAGGRFKGGSEVRIWQVADRADKAAAEFPAPVKSVAISSNGRLLAVGAADKTASVWNVSRLLGTAPAVLAATGVAPAPAATPAIAAALPAEVPAEELKKLRAGIIGLDTSHVVAFSQILNDPDPKPDVANCRIVAAYPKGSPDIESSVSRVPGYITEVQKHGVEIVDSIDALLKVVDVVFLETNDGRPHLEQVLPVLKAGKPVFIDKPIAASLADAIAIFEASQQYKVPLFSSSSLRFSEGPQALRNGKIGKILGCDTYSPCSLEKTHPDLYWYGIHGVETLFTVMGPGCESVTRTSTPGIDLAVGQWKEGRVGTFRGIRNGKSGYGGTAFGVDGIEQVGSYGGYRPLLVEIVKFFRTGVVPVTPEETLEIYAFMEAADESKRQGGVPVTLESVMAKARAEVKARPAAASVNGPATPNE